MGGGIGVEYAIYRVMGRQVVIYVVADGRRDMQTVLARRLLRGGERS